MHIAIEGMDGVGKTSQAKTVAKILNYEFIAKSFHEMNDSSGKYDNFFTIKEYTDGRQKGIYGLRQNYYLKKIRNENIVTDRFYVSNYWSRAKEYPISYFKSISKVWGKPDLIVLLYAESEILHKRICERNPNDKDLWKTSISEKAYELMIKFVKDMHLDAILINTSNLEFYETTDIILYASKYGIDDCKNKYSEYCTVYKPDIKKIEYGSSEFYLDDVTLVSCITNEVKITIPNFIEKLGDNCFSKCTQLKKLYISKNINEISDFAFDKAKIVWVNVDSDNLFFKSIDGALYDKSGKKLIKYFQELSKLEVSLPDCVEVIDNKAFSNCGMIKKLILPQNLKKIRYGAFIDCKKLENIFFKGNNLEEIQCNAFCGCIALRNIYLPGKNRYYIEESCIKDKSKNILLFIGYIDNINKYVVPKCNYIYPFAYMNKINTDILIISDLTQKIGSFAFMNSSINKIIIGSNIKELGEKSFFNTYAEMVRIKSNSVPEAWKNSFDSRSEICVNKNIRLKFANNSDWKDKIIKEHIMEKNSDTSCGTSCLNYILHKYNKTINFTHNFYWVMELGIQLKRIFNWNVELIYYNSRLMKDYISGNISRSEDINQKIETYLQIDGIIKEIKINTNILISMKKQHQWIIMNVRSSLLFNDNALSNSNHFIILEKCDKDNAIIIVPGRYAIYRQCVSTDKLLNMIQGNGQWILLAKE